MTGFSHRSPAQTALSRLVHEANFLLDALLPFSEQELKELIKFKGIWGVIGHCDASNGHRLQPNEVDSNRQC